MKIQIDGIQYESSQLSKELAELQGKIGTEKENEIYEFQTFGGRKICLGADETQKFSYNKILDCVLAALEKNPIDPDNQQDIDSMMTEAKEIDTIMEALQDLKNVGHVTAKKNMSSSQMAYNFFRRLFPNRHREEKLEELNAKILLLITNLRKVAQSHITESQKTFETIDQRKLEIATRIESLENPQNTLHNISKVSISRQLDDFNEKLKENSQIESSLKKIEEELKTLNEDIQKKIDHPLDLSEMLIWISEAESRSLQLQQQKHSLLQQSGNTTQKLEEKSRKLQQDLKNFETQKKTQSLINSLQNKKETLDDEEEKLQKLLNINSKTSAFTKDLVNDPSLAYSSTKTLFKAIEDVENTVKDIEQLSNNLEVSSPDSIEDSTTSTEVTSLTKKLQSYNSTLEQHHTAIETLKNDTHEQEIKKSLQNHLHTIENHIQNAEKKLQHTQIPLQESIQKEAEIIKIEVELEEIKAQLEKTDADTQKTEAELEKVKKELQKTETEIQKIEIENHIQNAEKKLQHTQITLQESIQKEAEIKKIEAELEEVKAPLEKTDADTQKTEAEIEKIKLQKNTLEKAEHKKRLKQEAEEISRANAQESIRQLFNDEAVGNNILSELEEHLSAKDLATLQKTTKKINERFSNKLSLKQTIDKYEEWLAVAKGKTEKENIRKWINPAIFSSIKTPSDYEQKKRLLSLLGENDSHPLKIQIPFYEFERDYPSLEERFSSLKSDFDFIQNKIEAGIFMNQNLTEADIIEFGEYLKFFVLKIQSLAGPSENREKSLHFQQKTIELLEKLNESPLSPSIQQPILRFKELSNPEYQSLATSDLFELMKSNLETLQEMLPDVQKEKPSEEKHEMFAKQTDKTITFLTLFVMAPIKTEEDRNLKKEALLLLQNMPMELQLLDLTNSTSYLEKQIRGI